MQALASFVISIIIDTSFSWVRMLIALLLSVVISLFVGIYAATNKTAERIIIPIWDIFQTLPILAFFPFVIFVMVAAFPGYIGINAAVIFLIVTSMIWNITFGVYESIKTIPEEFFEVGKIFRLGGIDRFTKILIPASMPRVVEQSILSWSIGLFYLVTSEIFSTGNMNYTVKHGIGAALTNLAFSGNFVDYLIGVGVFICFVVATRLILFNYLKRRFSRYTVQEKRDVEETRTPNIAKTLYSINPFSRVRLQIIHRNIINIRNRFIRPVNVIGTKVRLPLQKPRRNWSDYRHLFYIALLLFALYTIYSYRGLVGAYQSYEYEVLGALAASIVRVWLAFLVILAVSLPVGVYLVFISRRSSIYLLLFQIIASIPATILLPLIVLSLRNAPLHNELVAFVVFFLSGIWYMIFSIASSRTNIPNSVYEVKSIFGVKGRTAWKDIYVKAVLPGLITGAITAIAAEWNASIVAERFTTSGISNVTTSGISNGVVTSVGTGLGKLLDVSLSNGNITLMVLGLINLTIVILLVNRFVWKRLYNRILTPYR